MADSLIVGNFLGNNALAAVSSSGNLIFLMVGFFGGIGVGAGVVIARYFGAGEYEKLKKAIHTALAFGGVCGIFLTVAALILAPQILKLIGTPEEVLPKSLVYFRVYFAGSLGFEMCIRDSIWIDCDGRLYSSEQYTWVPLYVSEFDHPGMYEFYQSELWCG